MWKSKIASFKTELSNSFDILKHMQVSKLFSQGYTNIHIFLVMLI